MGLLIVVALLALVGLTAYLVVQSQKSPEVSVSSNAQDDRSPTPLEASGRQANLADGLVRIRNAYPRQKLEQLAANTREIARVITQSVQLREEGNISDDAFRKRLERFSDTYALAYRTALREDSCDSCLQLSGLCFLAYSSDHLKLEPPYGCEHSTCCCMVTMMPATDALEASIVAHVYRGGLAYLKDDTWEATKSRGLAPCAHEDAHVFSCPGFSPSESVETHGANPDASPPTDAADEWYEAYFEQMKKAEKVRKDGDGSQALKIYQDAIETVYEMPEGTERVPKTVFRECAKMLYHMGRDEEAVEMLDNFLELAELVEGERPEWATTLRERLATEDFRRLSNKYS